MEAAQCSLFAVDAMDTARGETFESDWGRQGKQSNRGKMDAR